VVEYTYMEIVEVLRTDKLSQLLKRCHAQLWRGLPVALDLPGGDEVKVLVSFTVG